MQLCYPQGYSDKNNIKQKQLHQDPCENERSSLSGDLKLLRFLRPQDEIPAIMHSDVAHLAQNKAFKDNSF